MTRRERVARAIYELRRWIDRQEGELEDDLPESYDDAEGPIQQECSELSAHLIDLYDALAGSKIAKGQGPQQRPKS